MLPEVPEEDALERELADWGKVILLRTRGRRSGRTRQTAVGFVEESDGDLLVAAAEAGAGWALNLGADPRCRVEREGRVRDYLARPLDGDARRAAIAALILKYGTPAERQGGGPAFRLVPTDRSDGGPATPHA